MATNVQINTGDLPVAIYFQDGSQMTIDPNSNDSIQLVENGFCTISEIAPVKSEGSEETSEHPPQGYAFVEMMIKFWQKLASTMKQEALDPTATPQSAPQSTQRRDYKKET